MIQPQELRIGNWVNVSGNTIDTYQTSKPKQVSIEFLNAIKIENDERPDGILTWFSPIPLTPEILEKCGFVKYEPMMYRLKEGWHWIAVDTNSLYINGKQVVLIEYLHQLQNLYFALTGEELTINL